MESRRVFSWLTGIPLETDLESDLLRRLRPGGVSTLKGRYQSVLCDGQDAHLQMYITGGGGGGPGGEVTSQVINILTSVDFFEENSGSEEAPCFLVFSKKGAHVGLGWVMNFGAKVLVFLY